MNTKFVLLAMTFPIFVRAQEPMARSEERSSRGAAITASLKSKPPAAYLFDETREVFQEKILEQRNGEKIGTVRLTVRDQHGEPLARDVFVKVEIKCAGQTSYKTITPAFTTCAFKGLEHDRVRSTLVIHYRPPTVIDGRFGCDPKASQREIKISCSP